MLRTQLKQLRTLLCVIGLSAVSACTTLSGLEKAPRVSLVNLKPVQILLLEQRYLATIRVQNPNPVDLPIRGLDYTISINGSKFADGVSAQRITIPAYGEKTIDLGITSTIVTLLSQLRQFGESTGKVTYRISGTLGIEGLLQSVDFAKEGEIDLNLQPRPRGKSI